MFSWATSLSSEKADSVLTHLLEVMVIMGIPVQIMTDNALEFLKEKETIFVYYNVKHITIVLHNPTGRQLKKDQIKC